MKKAIYFLALILFIFSAAAQKKPKTIAPKPDLPALDAIKEADLKRDLYTMASDHFRGREAGTIDELKVSAWWAEEARKAGLQPAGDDGTYFQFFSIYRNRISPSSTVSIGGNFFDLWKDVLVAQTAIANVSAPVVFAGNGTTAELDKADIKGKAVAIRASPDGINLAVSIPERRYPSYVLNKYRTEVIARGAVAIIFIADEMGEKSWSQVVPAMSRGLYDIEGGPNATITVKPPVLWVHASALDMILKKKAMVNININVESFLYPSVNIVAAVEGRDKTLKSEYVLFSGHQDHDGVRQPYGTDSIYNGADDNASVSVALMAIARAFKKNPGKRSALFVWHGAEERGLLGSKWYSSHPT
ncbi:MAG: M28 family peptidase, partial [Bacteroidota bacterium]|nr:M28 family peptidase [Bacteroidota bacterium]